MPYSAFVNSLNVSPSGELDPAVQEEYLNTNNTLDITYLSKLLNSRISEATFRKDVNNILGRIHFTRKEVANEVSKDTFIKYYEFGRYPNPRAWIGYFYRVHGLVLTRKRLYDYITS